MAYRAKSGISASYAQAVFGLMVSPHGFCDALITTVAITAPEQIMMATPLLGYVALLSLIHI